MRSSLIVSFFKILFIIGLLKLFYMLILGKVRLVNNRTDRASQRNSSPRGLKNGENKSGRIVFDGQKLG